MPSRPLIFFLVLAIVHVGAIDRRPARGAESEAKLADDHPAKMKEGLKVFKTQVRGVLAEHCLECHGGESVKAGFDLSTRESLLASGYVGDDAASSHLLALVSHAQEPHMPFKQPKLADEAIAQLTRWLDLGAPYDQPLVEAKANDDSAPAAISEADRQFWSFQPLSVAAPPKVKDENWVRTPIDRFILARQEEKGLHPNGVADRRTLIRRAYFDLLGLPPAPEEVEAFVADDNPHAYEKLIDRLLQSPHYGERWARHWMDVARFAESHGYEQDYNRDHAYHYRDFLIKALNNDMPYDQFVRWQIAGDELAPDDPLAMTATGFLGAGAFPTQLTEAEFESARYDELDDMLSTTGSAFLGLSIGCARCHDHKFDPIPAADYYRLLSTFTTTIRSEIDLRLAPEEEPTKVMVTSEGYPHMEHHADGRGYPHFYEQTYFLQRGDVKQKDGVAQQGFLQVLMRDGYSADHWKVEPPADWDRTSFRRASLANWLTDAEHGAGHLAARVIVNRLWHHHFGRGLVATPNDFGFQGERPTHPALLDWLAVDLIHHGWRLKRLHKLIMTSAAYMQSTDYDERRAALDRENKLLWRRAPRRLEAEAVRDSLLSVGGLLDDRMFGPGSLDENMRRRSVYFFIKRSQLIPMMMLFDWPEHLVSIGRRSQTTIAPQALALMNGREVRRCAEGLAARTKSDSTDQTILAAYRLALGRAPTSRERELAIEFIGDQEKLYEESDKPNARRLALVDFCQTLLSSNEFIYVE